MPPHMRRATVCVLAFAACLSCLGLPCPSALARPVSPQSPDSIAAAAQVLVAAETKTVTVVKKLPTGEAPYTGPMLEKQAKFTVLRVFPADEGIKPHDTVYVSYVTWDSPSGQGPPETFFPTFAPGDCRLLPLKRAGDVWKEGVPPVVES